MSRATITLTDEDGQVDVQMDFDPPMDFTSEIDEEFSQAQYKALQVMEFWKKQGNVIPGTARVVDDDVE